MSIIFIYEYMNFVPNEVHFMSPNNYLIQLGEQIKSERNNKGLTQYKLAKELFMEQSNLARIENGKTNPTVNTLIKIAKVLDCKVKDLINF